MKSFIKTAALSFLTVSSLALIIPSQASAFASNSNREDFVPSTTTVPTQKELDLSENHISQDLVIADSQTKCVVYPNGYYECYTIYSN
jgi:hypothetical protein